MDMLLGVAFSLLAAAVLLFWALFFLIVLPRIHDRGLIVEGRSRFGFLFIQWPLEELEAYEASLLSEERRKWFNLYLLRAGWLATILASVCAIALLLAALT